MKIAYAFHRDAANVMIQSSRPASILREFRRIGLEVEDFFPLQLKPLQRVTARKIFHRLFGKYHRMDREETYLRDIAAEFNRKARNKTFDLIFCPGSEVVTYLNNQQPIAFCADATFANMVDYYWDFTNLSSDYLKKGHEQERLALSRAALAIYPSEWAAQSAIKDYGADPAKVAVIPFGANLGRDNTLENVQEWIAERPADRLNLIFVGRHWQRKGGDLALETVRLLREGGISATLDMIGCIVPPEYQNLDWVFSHGSLQANQPAQAKRLAGLFSRAHFLLGPSRAEAYGMTYCEANAYGVPAVASSTGGISSIIKNGKNGLLLPEHAEPKDFAREIAAAFASPAEYKKLCFQSFSEFEERLNWRTFCKSFLEISQIRIPELSVTKMPTQPIKTSHPVSIDGRPIRAAYVVSKFLDPGSSKSWSGLPYNIKKSLEMAGVEFVPGGPLIERGSKWRMFRFLLWRFLAGKRFLRNSDTAYLKDLARQCSDRIKSSHADIIFAPSTWSIAYLETNLPIVFWTDATFMSVLGFYKSFENLAPPSLRDADAAEKAALDRCSRAIYSSDWAAESARKDYSVPAEKLVVVPFGANMDSLPNMEQVEKYIAARPADFCELLLVGVEWERKGAAIAIDTLVAYQKLGGKARLTIVGCSAPEGTTMPEGVEIISFIEKKSPEGQKRLHEIFARTHFFLMPTRADCTPVVYSEANSFGIPCLTTDVGGIPTIVKNGKNGQLFPLTADGSEYAKVIHEIMQSPEAYQAFGMRSKIEAEERLSWDVAGRRVAEILKEVILEKAPKKIGN